MTRPSAFSSGPPELPAVDGGVSLDHVPVDAPGLLPEIPSRTAYDADRNRRLGCLEEAKRIAQRNGPLSYNRDLVRMEGEMRQRTRRIHLDQCQIGGLVRADKPRVQGFSARQGNRDLRGVSDYVVIGNNVAVRGDEKARAPGFEPGAPPPAVQRIVRRTGR